MVNKIKKKLIYIGQQRLSLLCVFFFALFGILIARLFDLQIINGSSYANNFEVQITKTRTLKGTRGNIYDRNGKVIAGNRVSFSVTLEDNGTYDSTKDRVLSLTSEIYQLCKMIKANGDTIDQHGFLVYTDENDQYYYSGTEGTTRNRFRADIYGRQTIADMTESEKTSGADTLMKFLSSENMFGLDAYSSNKDYAYTAADFEKYGLPYKYDESGKAVLDLTNQERLEIIIIRYQMKKINYQKYVGITVASGVSEKTVAAVSENCNILQGVSITEDSERVYNDGIYFSSIIGYTGAASFEEIDELNATLEESGLDTKYNSESIVGKTGLEQYLETILQGTNGSETVIVNNVGKELSEVEGDRVQPTQGNNVYTSIDYDLQIATYKVLEQRIAGIIISNLKNIKDFDRTAIEDNTSVPIPIYDVYNALIENSVIDINHFDEEDASETERRVYQLYLSEHDRVLNWLNEQFLGDDPVSYEELTTEQKEYEDFVINTLLTDTLGILVTSAIDKSDDVYVRWNSGEGISMQEFLRYATSKNWMDVSQVSGDDTYLDTDEIYNKLVELIILRSTSSTTLTKIVYHYMLMNDVIDGYDICNILYDQNILTKEDAAYRNYVDGDLTPFELLKEKITNLEITPAQLALDPCSGSAVITDPGTGAILACVSYPGYDNNRLANQMDTVYWTELNSDQSSPLYNKATQQRTAPGSTFKPVSAVAGIMEGVITETTEIECTGLFGEGLVNESDYVHCWYSDGHGVDHLAEAIRDSCNVFFCTIAYRLGLDENGEYHSKNSLEKIQEYASIFCLDQNSGIELSEATPKVTTQYPIPSAIGQGTHSYTTTQLARYVTTLANRGTVYNISLLQKVEDPDGNEIYMGEEFGPTIENEIELSDSMWDIIYTGMEGVIRVTNVQIFGEDYPIQLYGKTGTAEEDKSRANHGLFVGFSLYSTNDDIAMAIRIAYGYSSANAELVAKDILDYYYGLSDSSEVLTGAADTDGVTGTHAD